MGRLCRCDSAHALAGRRHECGRHIVRSALVLFLPRKQDEARGSTGRG